jgi:REP element-mobilizing transposase RayT
LTFLNRHSLPHHVPLWVDPLKEVYFITINCQHRGRTQLTHPELAGPLLDTVKLRNERFIWFAHIFLLMPDHVHALLSFPPSRTAVQQTVTLWKRWTARQRGIEWQRDFFEHRLRSDESWREKADYILANPVRKGLITISVNLIVWKKCGFISTAAFLGVGGPGAAGVPSWVLGG